MRYVPKALSAIVVAAATLLGGVLIARGQIFSYEADVLPADGGWTVINELPDAVQFIEDGWLVQIVNFLEDENPPFGQQFDYTRSLSAFDKAPDFFVEWHLHALGDSSEIPFIAPSSLTIAGFGEASYRFVIARDQIRFSRDNPGPPPLFFNFTAETPHVWRIEIVSDLSYVLYLDGAILDQGIPGGPFPTFMPQINIRAGSHLLDNEVRWDYIRYGRIPAEFSADFNSDGLVDDFEIFYISECVDRGTSCEAASPSCTWADADANNTVNCDDWTLIANSLWTGPGAPPDLPACSVLPIPAVSSWGIAILTLLTLTVATLLFRRPHRLVSLELP